MPAQTPTVTELKHRYRNGERHFAGMNLKGASLRGMNLRDIDLTGADLSHSDLRGTNFTNAKLVRANLNGAKTGTLRYWVLPKLLVAWILTGLSSFLSTCIWIYFALQLVNPYGADSPTSTVSGDLLVGITGLGILIGFLLFTYYQGISASLRLAIAAFAIAGAVASGLLFIVVGLSGFLFTFSVIFAFVFVFVVTFAGTVAVAVAGHVAGKGAIAIAGITAVAFAIVGAFVMGLSSGNPIKGVFTVSIAVAVILITLIPSYQLSHRALKGDPRDQVVRTIAVWCASLGGTQFRGADLTDANCSQATLKGAHLYGATLTRTNLHLAKQVNLARLGKTILSDFAVQDLLITLRGAGKSYIGCNLKGAYLAGADLADANFTEADLSQATLEGADLQRVNFTKTQGLHTQFRQANLTGACLESWNINSTTQLDGAICDYVYLLNQQQERRPQSGTFAPGEFTKLFEEVLDTIDLIFRNGIDWKAFIQTFRQVQVQQEGAEIAIQSIENKGDGVVVVKLNAAPGLDKTAVHQSFMSGYQTAFQEAEERYKAQLHAKDEQIQDYRQQNANMQEVVKLLAARPINVDVQAIAESKTVQGNDQSQNFNVQGNFNINAQNSVVNLRDISGQVSNQISQLSAAAPTDSPTLKDLLTQLQAAIEADSELGEDEKAEALTEVGELAKAAQKPQEGTMQKLAKRSINVLKGMAAALSETSQFVVASKELLPLILSLF